MKMLSIQSFTRPSIGFAAILLFMLTACAPVGTRVNAEYSDRYSRDMFDTGYSFIADRYIDPVSLHELSISGLAGLKQIDPRIDIRPNRQRIEVLFEGNLVGSVALPRNDDPDAWSAATVNTIALARRASPTVASAEAEAVFKAVFDGVLEPLDRFSRYDDAETAMEKRAYRDGFGGIGITIRMEEQDALIITVNENGPAARAGVLPQDRITHVEGEPIAGWTQRELVTRLRGPVNTRVSFTVRRETDARPVPIRLTRRHVVPETATVERVDGVASIGLSGFNVDSAKQLERLVRREMDAVEGPPLGFVLDLRSNPGGRLDSSIKVSDLFLDGGAITATRGRHPGSRQVFKATRGDIARGLPIVILINGNSASASEIVAAALQDNARGIVIGTNSYGKGTVQSVLQLPNEGEMTLTWSRFLAPSGYRLHDLGVLPSVCTHGGGDTKSAESLVPAVRHGEDILAGRLNAWRATGNADQVGRDDLRELCPSDGGTPDVDLALARAIISDPALYKSLLNEAQTTVAER
ncbi:MAG: PDZ domain-containing protein [Alphaproteobacteria bacterium]|nr:PDZ domain-containing protein [Alphaproteobacteria bacterium]